MNRAHITEIDTFRACAIALVAGFHYCKAFFPGAASPILFGWTGVDLFFVISGFVLFLQFKRRYLRRGTVHYRTYFRNRFLRIAPAFYAALLAEVLVFHPVALLSIPVLCHLTFTHMATYDIAYSIMPIYWTLAVEAEFYVFLIVFGRIFLDSRGYVMLFVITALSVAYRYVVSAGFGFTHTGILLINHLPGRFAEFCCGIALAKLYLHSSRWEALTTGWLRKACLAAAGIIIYAWCAHLWLKGGDPIFNNVLVSTVFHPLVGLAFTLIMLPLMSISGRMKALLRLRPIVFLGLISYSLYLWHMFVLRILMGSSAFMSLPGAGLRFSAALGLALLWAAASYFLIERTFLRFKAAS